MNKIIAAATLAVGTIVIVGCLLALPTMWLWNALCPDLFHLSRLVFWQALGLNLLCGILFRQGHTS